MPTYFAGIRSTADFGADERPKEFREGILFLNPNGTAPMFALSSKASTAKKLTDPEFSWWYEIQSVPEAVVTTAALSTDSSITASAGTMRRFVAGDVLLVKTGITTVYSEEIVRVSSITSTTSIIIQRGAANTTPAAISAGVTIKRIGTAFSEGTLSPDVASRNPDKRMNLAQIFKTAFEGTRTNNETKKRTGDSWANDKKRRMFEHSADIEMAAFWGKRYETVGANGKPLRYMGGLRENMTNVTVYTSTPTIETFMNAVSPCFDYDSESGNERIAFVGNGFMNNLNLMYLRDAQTNINFSGELRMWGMDLTKVRFPFGTIGFKTHPLFNRDPQWTYCAFILDMPAVRYRPLHDTEFQDNIQANDADSRKAQWLTEASFELEKAETSCFLGNFTRP